MDIFATWWKPEMVFILSVAPIRTAVMHCLCELSQVPSRFLSEFLSSVVFIIYYFSEPSLSSPQIGPGPFCHSSMYYSKTWNSQIDYRIKMFCIHFPLHASCLRLTISGRLMKSLELGRSALLYARAVGRVSFSSTHHCLPFHTFGAEGDLRCGSKHFLCHAWVSFCFDQEWCHVCGILGMTLGNIFHYLFLALCGGRVYWNSNLKSFWKFVGAWRVDTGCQALRRIVVGTADGWEEPRIFWGGGVWQCLSMLRKGNLTNLLESWASTNLCM